MPDRPTILELAARKYLEKRDKYAREIVSRAGVPYDSESISEDRAYELFYQKDVDVDEQRTWMEAAAAVAAKKLPPDRVAAFVIEKVFPARIAVTEGGGRTDLKSQARFVARMVARRKRDLGIEESEPMGTEPQAEQAPEMTPETGGY